MQRILLWDGPNMDMQLSEILGKGQRAPTPGERPDTKLLMKWFTDRSGEDDHEACVFVNVGIRNGTNPKFHGWLRRLLKEGYVLFAKPKSADDVGDIDKDMLDYIAKWSTDQLREVIIASHDAANFSDVKKALECTGISVVILGFTECMTGYGDLSGGSVVDLESIAGVFSSPLPRELNIWCLPEEGKYFMPSSSTKATPRLMTPRLRSTASSIRASSTVKKTTNKTAKKPTTSIKKTSGSLPPAQP